MLFKMVLGEAWNFPVKSAITFKPFPLWCQDIIISLVVVGARIFLALISENNLPFNEL